MHGPKPHKGLLKRIRLTKSGKVKVRRAHGRHLRSHKSGELLRSYRKPSYLADVELETVGKMLKRRLLPGGTPRKVEAAEQDTTTESVGKSRKKPATAARAATPAPAPGKTTRKTTAKK